MTLSTPRLKLTVDIDGDGDAETGIFQFPSGNPGSVDANQEPIYPIGSEGAGALDTIFNTFLDDDDGRKEINLDLGLGQRFWVIEAEIPDGASNVRWGDNSGSLPADATGRSPIVQQCVFEQYLAAGSYDSRGAAVLEYGEYSSTGAFEPLTVSPRADRLRVAGDNASVLDVAVRCKVVGDLDDSDAASERPRR